jgi:hypothetical protein
MKNNPTGIPYVDTKPLKLVRCTPNSSPSIIAMATIWGTELPLDLVP